MTTSDTPKRERVGPEDESREAPYAADRPDATEPTGEAGAEPSAWAEGAGHADAVRLTELEAENAELRDRMLRLAADMENLRRRTEREIKDNRQFAVANFARDMLAVADNLDRALTALPADARTSGDAGFAALVEGVEMTGRAMASSLERHGVRKLQPEGQRFDPNFHQAMFEVPNIDLPNNTVTQVVQDGYAIGDRVLRPAMVGVSKGGPKPGAAEVKPAVPDEATRDA